MGIGSVGTMFPDVGGNLHRTTILFVHVDDRGVFADGGGVEEVADGILGRLPTHDDLVGIGDHPNYNLPCDQAFSTEGKYIGEAMAIECVRRKKWVLRGLTSATQHVSQLAPQAS